MINKVKKDTFFSVVVLNWNSYSCLNKCLLALKNQCYRNFEVIIIDNGSHDESLQFLKESNLNAFLEIKTQTVFNSTNLGFAAGMNQGFNLASGDWIMALNVDLFLKNDFLAQATRIIDQYPNIDMLGSKIYRYANGFSNEIICTGVWPTKTMSVKTDLKAVNGEYEVFGPGGCCPLFSRKALRKVAFGPTLTGSSHMQFYDNLYFAYGEDVDLFLRLALLDYKCLYSSNLVAWHVHSATQAGIRWFHKDHQTLRRLAANAISTWIKNYPGRLLSFRLGMILALPLIMSAVLLRKSPLKFFWPLVGYIEVIKRFKGLIKKRAFIQGSKQISLAEFIRLF